MNWSANSAPLGYISKRLQEGRANLCRNWFNKRVRPSHRRSTMLEKSSKRKRASVASDTDDSEDDDPIPQRRRTIPSMSIQSAVHSLAIKPSPQQTPLGNESPYDGHSRPKSLGEANITSSTIKATECAVSIVISGQEFQPSTYASRKRRHF